MCLLMKISTPVTLCVCVCVSVRVYGVCVFFIQKNQFSPVTLCEAT